MRDLMNNVEVRCALAPKDAAITDTTAQVGEIIDTLGYDSLMFAIVTGTLADADATFAVKVEHGDDSGLSDAADAGADAATMAKNLIGTYTLAAFTFGLDKGCRKIGYRGLKRYARITITPAANTGNAAMAVIAILGHPHVRPTPNPPA